MKVSKNFISKVLAALGKTLVFVSSVCVYACICVLLHACGFMRVDEGERVEETKGENVCAEPTMSQLLTKHTALNIIRS